MSRPALPPAQIIEAARTRLAKAKTAESIRFEECTAVGMLGALEDLRLIDMDTWRTLRNEFDALADSRRALLEGGAQ
ncbi:conserved hypothetical protein [Pseudomonas sp. OF001]|uniref:hypothetical protein n=1 Tax=Pseudomonas sp. OF001 TaxID=2772300 RepID=UPI0019190182|nr:hypothetical protein [Pseudomonas sp. OF001]CAD5379718.1 conserved hypothetical protein [Pseudomonas sp. OF001]